jgi:hypothetical protein
MVTLLFIVSNVCPKCIKEKGAPQQKSAERRWWGLDGAVLGLNGAGFAISEWMIC